MNFKKIKVFGGEWEDGTSLWSSKQAAEFWLTPFRYRNAKAKSKTHNKGRVRKA